MKVESIASINPKTKLKIPLVGDSVRAGFPHLVDDYTDKQIDLNEELINHPSATFFVRVSGDSMKDAGIFSGDTLVVDRAENPSSGKVVVAMLNGEFTVKRVKITKSVVVLEAANKEYDSIHIKESDDFEIWGVVIHAIHSF